MTQKRYTEIPRRFKSIASDDPYVAGSEDIEAEEGKTQKQFNEETDERIATEVGRAEQAESTLDGKIAAEKTRAEGVEGGLNTRLQTVEQLAEISVGGGDIGIGTAADFESDDPEDLAKVPTIGAMLGGANDGVYDISARHSGTKYADLASALGENGANVPVGVRKGGMSVKFVQSSDNKYVQYRYMGTVVTGTPNPFLDTANWQGVVEDATDGSDNIVSAKGILQSVSDAVMEEIILTAKIIKNERSVSNPTVFSFYKGKAYIVSIASSNPITGTQLSLKLMDATDNSTIYSFENIAPPYSGQRKNYFFSPSEDYLNVRIGSWINIDSSLIGNTTLTYTVKELKESIDYIYFNSALRPSFTKDTYNITITLPATIMSIFDSKSAKVFEKDFSSSDTTQRTFEIGSYNRLVYRKNTATVEVVSFGSKNDYITLLSNAAGSVSGLLAGYYNKFYIDNLEESAETVNDSLFKVSIYPTSDSYEKPVTISTTGVYCKKTFDFKKDHNYRVIFVPRTDIVNSQSSQELSDGHFSIKIATASKTTIIGKNYTSAYAGQRLALNFLPTQDYDGALIGSWTSNTTECIFDVYVQEVIMSELYKDELDKKESVKQYSVFNAVFFSDIHGGENNLARMLDVTKTFNPNCIINGGDTVAYGYIGSDGQQVSLDWYNDRMDIAPCDVINAIGNHDAWDLSGWPTVELIPQLTAYNAYTKKVIDKTSGIVQPSDAAIQGLNYYYKDYSSIRLIVLDSVYGGNTNTQGPAIPAYILAQNTWLTSVLADAKTNNKTVIAVTHGLDPSYIGGTLTKVGKFNNLLTLGQSYSINGNTVYTVDGFSINKDTLDIVKDYIDGGGKFACWLVGHSHFDQTFKLSGYPHQLVFTTSTARYDRHTKDGVTSDLDNKQYDCFNLFSIVPDLGIIKIIRIGYSTNNTLNGILNFCYDYVNGNVIEF